MIRVVICYDEYSFKYCLVFVFLGKTVLDETGSGKVFSGLSSNEDIIWWLNRCWWGHYFLKSKMVQNSLDLGLTVFSLYLSKSLCSNAHFSLSEECFLRRCMKDICWSQQWTQFDLPRPILVIYWRFMIKKNIPSYILASLGMVFLWPCGGTGLDALLVTFPLLSVCVSENRSHVHYKIQETFHDLF